MNVRCLHVPLLACHLRCRQDEEYLVCRIVRIRVAVPEALHYELVALRQLLGHEYFGLAREERRMACEWRRVRCRTVVFSPFEPEPGPESGTAHEYSKELVAISYSSTPVVLAAYGRTTAPRIRPPESSSFMSHVERERLPRSAGCHSESY
jgi:hypothetical protein